MRISVVLLLVFKCPTCPTAANLNGDATTPPPAMLFFKCDGDASIGPIVRNCRSGFDFTIHFENVTFAIAPATTFLLLSSVRLLRLWQRPVLVHAGGVLYSKMVCDHWKDLDLLRLTRIGHCIYFFRIAGSAGCSRCDACTPDSFGRNDMLIVGSIVHGSFIPF